MKRKYSQKKSIREITTRKKYNGEASPYWDFTNNHKRFDTDNQVREDSIANPDMLSEDDNIFKSFTDENRSLKLQAINEIVLNLSPRQRQVFNLCVVKRWTLKKTGYMLYLTIPTVQSYLNLVREKTKKRYLELLEDQEIL